MLDQPNLKVVWHKEVVEFMHAVDVVEPTGVNVVMARHFVSSVVKMVTLWGISLRTVNVVEIRALELNLHQLLHDIGLHLEDPLSVLEEGQTVSMESVAVKSKRNLQVLLGVWSCLYFWFLLLLDPWKSLSFVTPYVANQFEILSEKLCEPFCISTLVGESIIVERFYHDCHVSFNYKKTMADLVELGMVDFDVILDMGWVYVSYTSIDCRIRVVKFQIPNELVIE